MQPDVRRSWDMSTGANPVRVTCALVERLKTRTDGAGVKLLVFMQHPAATIAQEDQPTEPARKVVGCADAAGIRVVDQFLSLRAIAKGNLEELWTHYVQGSTYAESTPMSGKGIEHAAKLVAAGLAKRGQEVGAMPGSVVSPKA